MKDKTPKTKNPHAVALGRKGGKASSEALTPQQRLRRARNASQARWGRIKSTPEGVFEPTQAASQSTDGSSESAQ